MKLQLTVLAIAGLWMTGCATTPITGRKQVLLVPEPNEIKLGLEAFEQTLADEPASQNQASVQVVNRVGQRIAKVANRPDYRWEFRVIASPQQNAFALPGGKVAIYEGILPVCQNEAGLAVVMSHEIAHALARHGGERMSHGYLVNGAERLLSYLTQTQAETRQAQFKQAYGVASRYLFVLPYSRKHESEADHMGVMLMAQAGYDPTEAPRFWTRFAAAQNGTEQPEFLSTHPADARRAVDLEALMPAAMASYQQAAEKYGLGAKLSAAAPSSLAGQAANQRSAETGPPAQTGFVARDPFLQLPATPSSANPLR